MLKPRDVAYRRVAIRRAAQRKQAGVYFTVLLLFVGLIAVVVNWILETFPFLASGWFWLVVGILVIGGSIYGAIHRKKERERLFMERVNDLLARYDGDNDIVLKILSGEIWNGQTSQMLVDAKGEPESKDQSVLKKCVRETCTRNMEVWFLRKESLRPQGIS